MIIGVISDTHKDKLKALPRIIEELKKRGADAIVHCGDIEPEHVNAELFGNLPVFCALVEEQVERTEFLKPPPGWLFTKPGNRICFLPDMTKIYLGHKRSFDFLTGSEKQPIQTLNEIRRDHDCVRILFAGHTHHQIFKQGRVISFVNPGAIESSYDGYEFAVIDTDTNKIVFSRLPKTTPSIPSFSVGVISDSLNISDRDVNFWKNLAGHLAKYGIKHIIHCGNILLKDVGKAELAEFEVFYNLRPDQEKPGSLPKNWHLISIKEPVVEISGYRFYVQLDLGATLLEKSEFDMHVLSLTLRREHPEISFILYGFTNDAFLEEGEQVRIINPGDVARDRNFAVIILPQAEIVFDNVPVE